MFFVFQIPGPDEGFAEQRRKQLLLKCRNSNFMAHRQFSYQVQIQFSTSMPPSPKVLHCVLFECKWISFSERNLGTFSSSHMPQTIFNTLESSSDEVIPPGSLREALSDHFQDRFFVGAQADASEALVCRTTHLHSFCLDNNLGNNRAQS